MTQNDDSDSALRMSNNGILFQAESVQWFGIICSELQTDGNGLQHERQRDHQTDTPDVGSTMVNHLWFHPKACRCGFGVISKIWSWAANTWGLIVFNQQELCLNQPAMWRTYWNKSFWGWSWPTFWATGEFWHKKVSRRLTSYTQLSGFLVEILPFKDFKCWPP